MLAGGLAGLGYVAAGETVGLADLAVVGRGRGVQLALVQFGDYLALELLDVLAQAAVVLLGRNEVSLVEES